MAAGSKMEAASTGGGGPPRPLMYGLLTIQQLFVYLTRFGYPYLVPFIVQEYGFNDAQRAQLLSIFVPGYVVTQIPGGYYAQKWGAKAMLIINLVGMTAIMAALPSAGALGVPGVSACLFGLGIMSGPFIPASTLMKVNWVPYGPSRAWALYVISLGSNLAKTVAALTIPVLCSKIGWRKASYGFSALMGAYAVIWSVVARNKPADAQSTAVAVKGATATAAAKAKAKAKAKLDDDAPPLMEMLRTPQVISLVLTNITRDLIDIHTFQFWGPTYFNVALGVPLAQVGKLLVWPSALTFFGKAINAAWESRMTAAGERRGEAPKKTLLHIRKVSERTATWMQALAGIGFVSTRNPIVATVCYTLVILTGTFHYSGLLANWVDVAGPDAANIMAWGNTANWAGGYLVTQILVWLQMRTGRWEFIFLSPMVLQVATGLLYLKVCSVDSARDYVNARRKSLKIKSSSSTGGNGATATAFDGVAEVPPDPVFFVSQQYKACTAEIKLNLGVGAYRTNDGQPLVLDVVKKAEQVVTDKLKDQSYNIEYLPIDGLPAFRAETTKLILGRDSAAIAEGRVACCQSLSGTGALRLAAEFIAVNLGTDRIVHISNPTWGNHKAIFGKAGLPVVQYSYFKPETKGLDFEGMMADLSKVKAGDVVLLHGCAHNPTGVDPTMEQWKQIAAIVKQNKALPFFDCAYQGYASGDLDTDAAAVRYFESEGIEMMIAQSYSKNFGLYGERIGALSVTTNDGPEVTKAIQSQLKKIVR